MKPQVVACHVNELLADDAIVSTDCGTVTTWAARYLQMRGRMMFSCSGMLATMAQWPAVHHRGGRSPTPAARSLLQSATAASPC